MVSSLEAVQETTRAAARADVQQILALAPLEASDLRLVWKSGRRLTAAMVIGMFPFLIIADQAGNWPVSPVLPGLLGLAVLILGLPFLIVEGLARRARKRAPQLRVRKLRRLDLEAKVCLAVAWAWFIVWLAAVV